MPLPVLVSTIALSACPRSPCSRHNKLSFNSLAHPDLEVWELASAALVAQAATALECPTKSDFQAGPKRKMRERVERGMVHAIGSKGSRLKSASFPFSCVVSLGRLRSSCQLSPPSLFFSLAFSGRAALTAFPSWRQSPTVTTLIFYFVCFGSAVHLIRMDQGREGLQ